MSLRGAAMGESASEVMRVESKADSGCERFLMVEVRVLESPAPRDWFLRLQGKAKRTIRGLIGERPFRALQGRASVAWKDAEARAQCIAYQQERKGRAGSRWEDVERYAKQLREGVAPERGPVFLHPKAIGSQEGLLRPIDGARRLMAAAEAGVEMSVVVVMGRRQGSGASGVAIGS